MTEDSQKDFEYHTLHDDFYKKLREKIETWLDTKVGKNHLWAEILLIAPDLFHLLIRLSLSDKVPIEEKGKLAIVIAYFISPLDLIPEGFIGPVGYIDDVALSCFALNSIVNKTDAEVVKSLWAGKGDILQIIKKVLETADEVIGKGLWLKIKKLLGSKI